VQILYQHKDQFMEKHYQEPIDLRESISPQDFRQQYLKTEKPVVLRGLWDRFPARHKWTTEYFRKELGNIEVGVFDGKNQKLDRSFKVPDSRMKFRDYLNVITANREVDLRLFLFNVFRHKPELRKDFSFPPLTKLYLRKVPFMFFGGKNSVVRMHQDMDWSNVFLTQLHGRKEVVLFHPKYSRLLYRYPFNVHTPVDIDKPDFEKFPGLKHVKGMRCILEPGDTLFIPSGYWHYIKYLEGGFAISLRALSPKPVKWVKGFWYVVVLSNIDDLMRWLLGKKWHRFKSDRSKDMADQELRRMILT
jgi:ribosomal protein L16 Arg81 hydroxylase